MKKNILLLLLVPMLCLTTQINANVAEAYSIDNGDYAEYWNGSDQDKQPTRTEKKSYSSILAVEFNHQYGNIFVKESKSKEIELIIEYYDTKEEKAVSEVSTSGSTLKIKTISSGSSKRSRTKINYIILLPKSINLNTVLKYGNMNIETLSGLFEAELSYSNLKADAIDGKAKINIDAKYSNVKINEINDATISAAYSNIKIGKAQSLDVSGDYNKYVIDELVSITSKKAIGYSSFNIGKIDSFVGDLQYSELMVSNLGKRITTTASYSKVKIDASSANLEQMVIHSAYSDMSVGLNPSLSANFDMQVHYGKISISGKYKVAYSVKEHEMNKISEKGTIGTKSTKANIELSNKYANIEVK